VAGDPRRSGRRQPYHTRYPGASGDLDAISGLVPIATATPALSGRDRDAADPGRRERAEV